MIAILLAVALAIQGHSPSPMQLLVVHPTISSEQYCAGDDELFTYRVTVAVIVTNRTAQAIVLPWFRNAIGRVSLAQTAAALQAGKPETEISFTMLYSGEAKVKESSFIRLAPGESRAFPGELRLAIPVARQHGTVTGMLNPGAYMLSFRWDVWDEDDAMTAKWQTHFRRRLWTEPLHSEPIRITIRTGARLQNCQ